MTNKLKRVKTMPKSGQFVAIWSNDNGVWSDTHKWVNGILLTYDVLWADDNDYDFLKNHEEDYEVVYYIKED